MTCAEAVDRILVAEPAELRGGIDTDLGPHLAGCSSCRAKADRILASQEALRAHLAAATPARPDPDALLLAAARVRRRRRLARLAVAFPALAAAGIAAVLLTREPVEWLVPTGRSLTARLDVPVVQAASGQNVAVFETQNPNITVVWIY